MAEGKELPESNIIRFPEEGARKERAKQVMSDNRSAPAAVPLVSRGEVASLEEAKARKDAREHVKNVLENRGKEEDVPELNGEEDDDEEAPTTVWGRFWAWAERFFG